MDENKIDEAWITQMVFGVVKRHSRLSGTIDPDMSLFNDIGMDKLEVLECCMDVEEELSDKMGEPWYITNEICDSIETVGDLIKAAKGSISI